MGKGSFRFEMVERQPLNRDRRRFRAVGMVFALLSPALIAGTYSFSSIALKELNPRSFTTYWMLTAGGYALLAGLLQRSLVFPKARSAQLGMVAVGLLEVISAACFFTAISLTHQTSVVSFLGQFGIVSSFALSVLVLKEPVSWQALAGMALVIAGTLVLSYSSGPVGWILLLLMFASTTAIAIQLVISKLAIAHTTPTMLLVVRNFLTACGVFILLPMPFQNPSPLVWKTILVGALLGPFSGFLMRFMAVERIEAWVVALFAVTLPLFVSIYDLLFFGQRLQGWQIVAGLLILIGALAVTRATMQSGGDWSLV